MFLINTMTFSALGYQIEKGAISLETAKMLSLEFSLLRDCLFLQNNQDLKSIGPFNDLQVSKSFAWYGPYCFETLLMMLHPKIEEITASKLYPTYSYGRIYYNGATMARHIDRPSCQYSATITLDFDSSPWAIWFQDLKNNTSSINLEIGDMCVYRGLDLPHWRDSFPGGKQVQAFLHYVDAEGEYKDLKYDRRKYLGFPSVSY